MRATDLHHFCPSQSYYPLIRSCHYPFPLPLLFQSALDKVPQAVRNFEMPSTQYMQGRGVLMTPDLKGVLRLSTRLCPM
jgi:hypothetical protein